MENKLQESVLGGFQSVRWKVKSLGLSRHWQVIASTLSRFECVSLASRLRVLDYTRGISALFSPRVYRYVAVLLMVFMVGIGNVWGDAITWDFTGRSSKQALSTDTEFEGSDGSTILTYKSPSNCVLHNKNSEDYLKMGGSSTYSSNVLNGRYFTLVAPSAAGTITVNYAGTVGNALISTGTNGTVIQSTITATANTECTSSAITGLTAGTTTIYIAFAAKSYINSITWTDAEAPSYASAYYSLVKTSMTGATLTASSATQQNGGSNLYADFANYYKTGNSTGYVNISFANPNTPIALNSNGSDCGRIKIYYGHTGAGNGFSLDVNSSTNVASYTAAIANRIYVAEYTIPDGTSSISSLKMTGSGSSGLYICAIDILTYSSGGGGDPEPSCGETAQAALELSASSGTICGTGTTTFTVSGGSGTGELSVSSSDETKATASIDGTTVTVTGVAAGSATITVTKACDATYAEKSATFSATVAAIPTANAGADKTTEPETGVALAADAAADGCTGAWTIVSGPNTSTDLLSNTSSATATFTPTAAGTYTLRWTVTNSTSSCSAYDEMTVTAATCAISSCGNATLTYPINVSESTTTSNLVSGATPTGTGIAVGATSFVGIEVNNGSTNNVAATNSCFDTKFTMSGKLEQNQSESYSSEKYLQFAFTVNSGYTFTPCDIQFVVQPVSATMNFRWEVTDGTNLYGYGTGSAGKGSEAGATVLTGLGSTAEMAAGNYSIRLYPYSNVSNTFRIGKDVILKGTTAEAETPSCAATAEAGANKETTTGVGVAMAATAATSGYTGAWSIKAGSPSTDAGQLGTTSSNTMTFTPNNTGTYTLVWTVTDDNDNTCYATSEATVTVTAPTHNITYNTESLKGSDVSSYPTEYTEGVGIASFAALADVTNFHFNGWSPASIGTNATEDVELTATWVAAHNVTFALGTGASGTAPATFQKWQGATFSLPGQGDMVAPSGYAFDGWNDGTNDYAEGDTYTMGNAAVTITAQWAEIPTHTISLDANGGSVASYEGWAKEGDVYSKTVEEGTEVSLLAFTKADVQLLFFRDGSANEYTSAVTLNADLSLKAVWGEEKEVELYYWEGKSGGATERGGTAKHFNADGEVAGNTRVNYPNKPINGDATTQYYTISLNGKNDWTSDYIKIDLDDNIKAGDVISMTAYCTNSSASAKAAGKMYTSTMEKIFEGDDLTNIYSGGSPVLMPDMIVPEGIDTKNVKMTRHQTGTNTFITKLVITGTRVIEVMDPAQAPTISAHPAGASYTWKDAVSALTVTAAVTDGGTLHYQWYKAGETDTKVGTDAASYTPEESGTYYVVVTNKKTGYSDKSTISNNAVVTIGTRPSYTVTYYDGASSLGTESVLEEANPAEYAAKQAKAVYGVTGLYEFNGWYNNSDLAEAHKIANIAALSITANTPIYGKWTRIEASSVDLAAYASADGHLTDNESTDAELNTFKTWFTGQGYVYANLYKLDKTTNNNGAYSGLKTRSTDAYVAFNVPANKRVTVKLGYMAAAAEMYINGVKNESQALTGGSTSTGNDNYADWKYDVTEASTFKLLMKSSSTCVVKAITIGEIPAASDDATLSDLKVDGTTVDGFAASTLDYYVELPYGTEDAPTVAGTANDANAKSVTPTQAESLPGNATIVVVAEDNTTSKTYTVHFSVAPKLGVELIKATHTGEHTANKAGYWSNDVTIDKTTQGGGKLGSDDHYFGLTLGTNKFMNGDLLCIYLKISETPSNWLQVFKDKGTNIIVDQQSGVKRGANYFTLSGLPEGGIDELYLYRKNSKMNPYVDYIAVYREMDPFFESFTVAGEDATIDETVSPKTINVEVPAVTDITALTPTYKAWANGGATVSPTTAQDFSAGAVEYTVTSAYSEATTYQVTVTKAAAIKEVVISGTLTVQEDATTTLSAVVYDTNDDEAANQNVEWSIPALEAEYATVSDAGVVTALKAGTVHVTATSEADDSKSATVEVVISENPCRTWNAPATSWSTAVVTVGKLQIARGDCPASNSVTPYSGASTMYGIKIDGSGKFIELTMSDGAQFESLTLGVSSGSNESSPKYVVVASSAKTFDADAVLSAVEYVANAKDAEQSLNVISLPTGTRNVRLYRTYDAKGDGTSVFLYYINACKKDLVALTSVAVADKSLAIGVAGIPAVTLTPANADVASYAWEIVSDETGAATINATTGAILSTAVGTVTVKVTATDVLSNVVESNICTVTIVDIVERVDVTGSMTWNWNGAGTANVSVATDRGLALANYISGDAWKYISGTNGDYAYNTNNSGCYQGYGTLSFKTIVPGLVTITARRISNDADLKIGEDVVLSVTNSNKTSKAYFVPAGEVNIIADATKGMRILKIEFDAEPTVDKIEGSHFGGYTREVNPQYYGTVCLPQAGVMVGATLFQVAYMDYKNNAPYKVYYDEVENGTMQAGMPYIFLAEQSTIGVYYTGTMEEEAKAHNGLHGTLVDITEGMNATGIYMLYNNKVLHSTNPNSSLPANRAYIQLGDEIPGYNNPGYQAPAPTRRRISTGFNGANSATGLENMQVSEGRVQKVLIDGKIYILRGEKIFDMTGKLVK